MGRLRVPPKNEDERRTAAVACPSCLAAPGARCMRMHRWGPPLHLAWSVAHMPRRVAAGIVQPVCRSCRQPLPQLGPAVLIGS